jgi:hypothetical protein
MNQDHSDPKSSPLLANLAVKVAPHLQKARANNIHPKRSVKYASEPTLTLFESVSMVNAVGQNHSIDLCLCRLLWMD